MNKDIISHLLLVLRSADTLPLSINRDWYSKKKLFNCSYRDASVPDLVFKSPITYIVGSGDSEDDAKEACTYLVRRWAYDLLWKHLIGEE